MCGIYCVYKQSRSCQLPFCASPIFHFEIGDFSVYILSLVLSVYTHDLLTLSTRDVEGSKVVAVVLLGLTLLAL